MKIQNAKEIIIAREEKAKAILAAAKEKSVDPDEDDDDDDEPEWDDDDFEMALKLIRDMSFQMKEVARVVSMHPHRRSTLENLVNDGMQFLCLFEGEEETDETDICTHCNAKPFTGSCDGSCMDYSG